MNPLSKKFWRAFHSTWTALGAAGFCCATAWIGGYNFDTRSDNVAVAFFFASLVVGTVFAITWNVLTDKYENELGPCARYRSSLRS